MEELQGNQGIYRFFPCLNLKKNTVNKIFMMVELQSDVFSQEDSVIGLRITTEKSILDYCSYLDVAIVVNQTFYKNYEFQHKEIDDIDRIKKEKEAKRDLNVRSNTMILGNLKTLTDLKLPEQ